MVASMVRADVGPDAPRGAHGGRRFVERRERARYLIEPVHIHLR